MLTTKISYYSQQMETDSCPTVNFITTKGSSSSGIRDGGDGRCGGGGCGGGGGGSGGCSL